ncbi:glycosyl hydrolase [Sphingomonas sp. LH128]|uniref:glycosyl hydrolase n=1 Tax=Sphingomonas sp. LH128 TaxID=473781 RepID=UPI002E160DA8
MSFRAALCLAGAMVPVSAMSQDGKAEAGADAHVDVTASRSSSSLEDAFRDPPASARPRVWWHWMNGNITKDGIAKDLAWMKRVGIGGMQSFDANLQTPQIVDKRLVYMTPEWKDAFRFAASEADRLGLELAIASSPGWSETGGPWVKPEDGLKKLVWTEAAVPAGRRFSGNLAAPPTVSGPYQDLGIAPSIEETMSGRKPEPRPQHYQDVAVLAVPQMRSAPQGAIPRATLGDGTVIDAAALGDRDLNSGVDVPRGSAENPATVVLQYAAPQTVRSASLYVPGSKSTFGPPTLTPVLETSDDGVAWRKVVDVPAATVPTTVSFPAVTARWFRIVLVPQAPAFASMSSAAPGIAMDFGAVAAAMGAKPYRLVDMRLSPEATIDQFETKAGFALAQDYYAMAVPTDGAVGASVSQVLDLTDRMRPDGVLDWTAPRLPGGGHWRVLRLGYSLLGTTNHPAPPEATGLEVDKFDGDAVRRYLDHYLAMYKDAAGADLVGARGVRALLTDSIEVGAANWTPRMLVQFRKLRGYDATPWLPALTGTLIGTREDSDRFLYDYRRTLSELVASEHYGTIASVAHESGLKVYGEALEDHRPSLGDDMAMRRYADVPMAAMWTHNREVGPRATYLADIKGAASVAHLYGQNIVAAESMTASLAPWAFAPKDLKRIIDLEFVNGVNRPVVHTSAHVPVDDKKPGLSLFIYGQYFNRQESWAELARPWVDYIARSSLMLQEGRNLADVAYFYGEEAPLTGLYGDKPVADAPVRYAYDFVNFDVLTSLLKNDGPDVVAPSGARYRVLYLGGSSHKMTLPALHKIAELARGGATIVGTAPVGMPGLAAGAAEDRGEWARLVAELWPGNPDTPVGKGRVIAGNDVEGALRTVGLTPDFAFAGAEEGARIPFVHRRDDKGDIYYLSNPQAHAERFEGRFRVTGKVPMLWHPETGTSEPVGYRMEGEETIVPLAMEADGAVFVVFREQTDRRSLVLPAKEPVVLARIQGPWKVAFEPGRGAPAAVSLAALEPLQTDARSGVRYFSGIATYTRSFNAPAAWKPGQPLWLDLGSVGDLAQVSVNGKDVGTVWHSPYRLDVSAALKTGRNDLEIRVANKWVNRLVGDAQGDGAKVTWTAVPTYRKDAPLLPSGLIGPVELLGNTP